MAAPAVRTATPRARERRLDVEIVVPAYNEERTLARSIERLHDFLTREFPLSWQIVIADNASTDRTLAVAHRLSAELEGVEVLHLDQKGRGRALRTAWLGSSARVVAYMDVDLSTDLRALLPLVAPLISGHSDVAIGSRLARGARVERGPKRELISRSYNMILRTMLRARFSDAQCGFKAVRADVAKRLLPNVVDNGWFFDTELLVLAQRRRLRIHEVPVDWVDDPDSRVDIVETAMGDLRGVARLLAASHIVRFAAIGVFSTVAYALIYLALRDASGAAGANAIALALTAVGNTQANRRWTFGLRGRERLVRHHAAGAIVFVLTLAMTSGALFLLHELDRRPSRWVELAVLICASVTATITRYVGLRFWVFTHRRPAVEGLPVSAD
ncbi:MAG TPA: bifunctional glycosyltransferase family 2/GtrA family protein [Thermoleophilaceae bacterium]|jgi:glycosyltransferase involved in cell wall biosynthesis|nr:bifunctional glycosyltransferase family 2/GtrA family protein [Thermoleophilaceae bacterium]